MRAKEYLIAQGRITEGGRGRLSLDNVAFLKDAVAKGMTFDNWPPAPNSTQVKAKAIRDKGRIEKSPAPTARKAEIANGGQDAAVEEIAPYLYNHTTHVAYERNQDGSKGRKRSLREVCFYCGVSLVQCTCGTPKVVRTDGQGHVSVTIVAETSQLPKGNVWDKPKK